jgi:hypothetical protein
VSLSILFYELRLKSVIISSNSVELTTRMSVSAFADDIISMLIESGIMRKWIQVQEGFNTNAGKKYAIKSTELDSPGTDVVEMSMVWYPIYILMIGSTIGFSCFLYELGALRGIRLLKAVLIFAKVRLDFGSFYGRTEVSELPFGFNLSTDF